MTINLHQTRADFDNGVMVCRETLIAVVDYAVELESRLSKLDPKMLAAAALKPHMSRVISDYDPCGEQEDAAVTVSAERLEVFLNGGKE